MGSRAYRMGSYWDVNQPRKSKGKRVATIEIDRSASMDFLSDAGFVQLGQAWATHAIRIICNVQVGSMHSEACAMVYHA